MIKRRAEKNKGITLVALVVTIVVLLILAGITVTMLFGDEGIINKAQDAADKTNESQSQEKNDIKDLSGILDDALIPIARVGKKVPDNTLYANFTAKTADNKDIKIPVPGGYKVVENTQKSNKIDDGIVIQDDLNNEFVWVPVNDEQFIRMYDATNKRGNLYNFGTSSAPKNPPTLWAYNTIGHREPDIVTGNASGTGTSYDGNSSNLSILGLSSSREFKTQLKNEFNNMIASVKEYKGFYIGRYETGSLSNSDNINIPKVQRGQTVGLDCATWYYQYAETKNLIKMKDASNNYVDNPNVTTSMIWGCQFDRTLEWIAQTNLTKDGKPNYSLLTDSSSWGNYSNYKEITGDTSTASGGSSPQPSGTNPNWQKNNIFDLAGNAYDWTIEANATYGRVVRGGHYGVSGSSFPASDDRAGNPDQSDSHNGSRSTLYINVK